MLEEIFKVPAIMEEFLDIQHSGFSESSRQQSLHKLKMSRHAQLRSRKEFILVEDSDEAMVCVREASVRRMDDMEATSTMLSSARATSIRLTEHDS